MTSVSVSVRSWRLIRCAVDLWQDVVELLTDKVHRGAALGNSPLEVVLGELAHDDGAVCALVDADDGAPDALGQCALVAADDGEVGQFGGFVDLLAKGADSLKESVEVLLRRVGLVVGEQRAGCALADDLGNVLAALACLVDLLDELDGLVDAGVDVAHLALHRLAAGRYQCLLRGGLVALAGQFLAIRREDNIVGPLLLQTRQGGGIGFLAQGDGLVHDALGGGFDQLGVALFGFFAQGALGLVRGGGSGDTVDLLSAVSGPLQVVLVAKVLLRRG
jgi:hypothetical protein